MILNVVGQQHWKSLNGSKSTIYSRRRTTPREYSVSMPMVSRVVHVSRRVVAACTWCKSNYPHTQQKPNPDPSLTPTPPACIQNTILPFGGEQVLVLWQEKRSRGWKLAPWCAYGASVYQWSFKDPIKFEDCSRSPCSLNYSPSMAEEVLSLTAAVACSDHELLLAVIMFV
jgi:hypothetical protein